MNVAILFDALALFRKGNEVANPEAWKDGGNAATLLVPLFMAAISLAGDFGIGIHLDATTAAAIAGGIVAAVHFVVLNVSSTRFGILPAKPAAGPVPIVEQSSAESADSTGDAGVQPVIASNDSGEPTDSLCSPDPNDKSIYFGGRIDLGSCGCCYCRRAGYGGGHQYCRQLAEPICCT